MTTASEYQQVLMSSVGCSPMPYLFDAQVQARAKSVADEQDVLSWLTRELQLDAVIPILRRSDFRAFERNGSRVAYDRHYRQRARQIELAAMACYLGMDTFDYLQDLLWAECEHSWWFAPAHEYVQPIDLLVAMNAEQYAVLLTLFHDRFEPEVSQRLRAEIDRRVFEPFLSPTTEHLWWRNTTNNWNAVCYGGIGIAAMLLEKQPERLTQILTLVLRGLPLFIAGFTEDGGCSEGPSYWRYGFGWYTKFASALYHFTGGCLNLMQQEKVAKICRYPLAVTIRPGQEIPFADAHTGFQSPATVCRINQFYDIPELFGLCRLTGNGMVALSTLEDLLLYDGRRVSPLHDTHDYLLVDVGVVKVVMDSITVGAKAGHNDEHHNHNDIGSFIVHQGDSMLLTDPGAPIYTAKTFGPRRYESIFTNSYGHSVPVIDGCLQRAGAEHAGTLEVIGANTGEIRCIKIEMAGAYDLPALTQLTRLITVPAHQGPILLTDTFKFCAPPCTLEEVFLATCAVTLIEEGAAVCIAAPGDEGGTAIIRAIATPGTFLIEEVARSVEESPLGVLLRRITFTPEQLTSEMTLSFSIECEKVI